MINKVSWKCPSNIALVKYWGKKQEQLPLNPSLSFSLKRSCTVTSMELSSGQAGKLTFLFDGEPSPFARRIERYLNLLSIEMPWINDFSFHIESKNTFPHSAGIASSASAFGALALCLADLDRNLSGNAGTDEQFVRRASRLARLGSGSAARSVYGGFAWWGKSASLPGSTDCHAVSVNNLVDPSFFQIRDAVLLVDSGKKNVSSSAGHELMNNHPYKQARILQANSNAASLLNLIKKSYSPLFFEFIENEALSLHALMMSSYPSFLLLKPESLEIISKIRAFREQTGLPVGFTIDAGPNIHFLYFEKNKDEVYRFIETELISLLENGSWLDDRLGEGPVNVE